MYLLPNMSKDVLMDNIEISKVTSYGDYTPKNNKCFVYPMNYLEVTNNIGNIQIFRYEDFENIIFKMVASLTTGISAKVVPLNHRGKSEDVDASIPFAKYPTCSWSGDTFTNWQTQNAVNNKMDIIGGAISSGVSMMSGNIIGGIVSMSNTVMSKIGEFNRASFLPNYVNGQNTGDVNFGAKYNKITFRKMRCKLSQLRIIDNYFSRFGYARKRIFLPNFTGRLNFNYVEIGSNERAVNGEIPEQAQNDINNACRKGVTVWHNHNNVGNFEVDNSIV